MKQGLLALCLAGLVACSNFLEPVESTGTPSEYEYNYWLLQRTYLYDEELPGLPEKGDSVQVLYNYLKDPYTRYYPPSKSEAATTQINTSFVPGDVGMEYFTVPDRTYPLFVYRVYPNGPADRAGIKRYSNIRKINGHDLAEANASSIYKSVLDTSATIELEVVHDSTQENFTLKKEDIYAPTIFIDTLYGTIFITITEFKLNTADRENGTYGELKAYLDSTQNETAPRVIDIRGNPGGHVNQCVPMADLFVPEGALSTRSWKIFDGDGERVSREQSTFATKGDPGEKGKFIILANHNSASCAEIFAAAVTELVDIPVVGTTTFGKGIGQTNWKTMNGGLAVITNLEFLTPKGNSYHKKGIVPKYDCGMLATDSCALDALEKHFGAKSSTKNKSILQARPSQTFSRKPDFGGAMIYSETPPFFEKGEN